MTEPGLLHAAVLVQEHRDGRADARLLDPLEEGREPVGLNDRVAVQEAEEPAARRLGALVRSLAEAAVDGVPHDGGAVDVVLDSLERVVRRRVVHEHELERRLGVLGERCDRAAGQLPAAVEEHHHRDFRLAGRRDAQATRRIHSEPPPGCAYRSSAMPGKASRTTSRCRLSMYCAPNSIRNALLNARNARTT